MHVPLFFFMTVGSSLHCAWWPPVSPQLGQVVVSRRELVASLSLLVVVVASLAPPVCVAVSLQCWGSFCVPLASDCSLLGPSNDFIFKCSKIAVMHRDMANFRL